MTIEQELPQRVCQTTKAAKPMLTVFLNPKEFALVNLLPQGRSFTAAYFVDNVTVPLANRQARQPGDISRRKLYLHFSNSKCHTARHVQEEIAAIGPPVFSIPHIHPI
jgi:hypothetical protein